jgi:PAS domain S-box-containing protein
MTVKVRQRGLAHFEKSVREFADGLAKGRARSSALRGPTTDPVQESEALRIALEELRLHQEELSIAEEELRAQLEELALASSRAHADRDHYRELFDASPDGYFVTDRLAVIRNANLAAAAIVNIERHFLVGKPLATMVDLADSRILRDAVVRLGTTDAIALELRLRPRGGEPIWHTLKATRIEGGTALLWIARDDHARHTASVALPQSQDDMRGLHASRLKELERANRDKDELLERERRLREELAATDTAKDRFIAALSHDLRVPINAVLGWTQLLRRERLDHAARDRALATIERNAQAQVRLVEELLDISRVASNKLQIERTTVDLSDLVRRGIDAVLPIARERGIELDRVLGDGIVIFGDRPRLEQVLTNLLSNALKFTPKGGRIIVSLESDGLQARITVQDTGRGVAPELIPLVFNPFRHATDYTSTLGGLGFGLYIVRRAVELHGGSVSAHSEGVGRGARFTVLLPIVAKAAKEESLPPPAKDLRGLQLLVIDEDEDRRELMASILQQKGAAVTTASDVAAALHAFDASQPDVVVADLDMTGRDALDLVRDIRGRPNSTAALVAISGFAAPEDVDRALTAGFDVHIAKPLDPAELVAAVGEAARGRRG